MTREKFPEKIPFRLTRMLTNAMEVSNNTCGKKGNGERERERKRGGGNRIILFFVLTATFTHR